MAVVVLPPRDCLRDGVSNRRPLLSPPRSDPRCSTATGSRTPPQSRSVRRKHRSPPSSPPQSTPNNSSRGQIRILKRGEELPLTKPSTVESTPVKDRNPKREGAIERAKSDPAVFCSDPAPAPIRNLFLGGFYAGSAFSSSPPPSSLPVPGFCTKSIDSCASAGRTSVEDVVAVDLRRMLRIEP